MTTPNESPENNSSEPVEPKVEPIYIGIGRGSYSALKDAGDTLKQFDKFLYPESGSMSGSMPDIDLNFVNGDKVRARFTEYIKERYGFNDGETSKDFERFLKPNQESYPDIDGAFIDGDRIRAQTLEYIKNKYANPAQPIADASPVLDGCSDKDEFTRQAREADKTFPIHSAEWFHLSIGPNGFFR